ncbi:hypothetical protein NECAME_06848 [Necator americanus]|uniref:Uncharacterized protein n=1 Tax=Necator americanus TaxID=51031 RepID=W2TTZ5_NECAM|nr:hypothetical protein NECAME_06848 [Necator americanus]ETN84527.1 hypothetical protein NECAME_06848 [Necator americanus]
MSLLCGIDASVGRSENRSAVFLRRLTGVKTLKPPLIKCTNTYLNELHHWISVTNEHKHKQQLKHEHIMHINRFNQSIMVIKATNSDISK